MPTATDEPPQPRLRAPRAVRQRIGSEIATLHAGVAHRAELRAAGLSSKDVASEVAAGRWTLAGRHTVVIGNFRLGPEALLWRAVWESGSGAVLDGAAALWAAGLKGFTPERIDVSIPANNRNHRLEGVRLHRRRVIGPVIEAGIPRIRPEVASVRAAEWARSDRQAALVLCLTVQQRLVPPERLFSAWREVKRKRRPFVGVVIRDVCDGAHSLGELDFARYCREYGLPEPSRQVVRTLPGGRVYLDVAWDEIGLVVEIDGGHHALALSPIDDALRQNSVVLSGERVLRIPIIGLRLMPDAFMGQVVAGHRLLGAA